MILIKRYIHCYVILFSIALSPCFLGTTAAAEISLAGSTLNGNDLFDFTASGGDLDFDVNFNTLSAVTLRILLNSNDLGHSELTWSGIYSNRGAGPWTDFHITLFGGPTFAETNVAELLSGGGLSLSNRVPDLVSIVFGAPESMGLLIGVPGPVDASQDWLINLNGLAPGASFDLELAPTQVPEPAAFLLTLTGLMLLALVHLRIRRRRPQGETL